MCVCGALAAVTQRQLLHTLGNQFENSRSTFIFSAEANEWVRWEWKKNCNAIRLGQPKRVCVVRWRSMASVPAAAANAFVLRMICEHFPVAFRYHHRKSYVVRGTMIMSFTLYIVRWIRLQYDEKWWCARNCTGESLILVRSLRTALDRAANFTFNATFGSVNFCSFGNTQFSCMDPKRLSDAAHHI